MAIVDNRPSGTGEDEAAITELHEIVSRQRHAFMTEPHPSLRERQALLGALAGIADQPPLADRGGDEQRLWRTPAVSCRSDRNTRPAGRAGYAAEQLET